MTLCLVLGANGFLGSHVAEALVRKNNEVRVFDHFRHGRKNLASIADKIEMFRGDFLNVQDLAGAMDGVDYIFHYISTTNAITSTTDPEFDIRTNVIGSVRLLECAVKSGVKKIFFPSSGGTVYGEPVLVPISEDAPTNPLNPYAISKLTIEKYLNYFFHQYGLDYVILRYSNPYGERQNPHGTQGVIPIFLKKVMQKEAPVIYGDGNAVRDYLYIEDAIEATMTLVEKSTSGRLFNIGSGKGVSLNQLIEIMSRVTGEEISPVYRENDKKYIRNIVLDISNISYQTGWSPRTDIVRGIEKTWDWFNREDQKGRKLSWH